MAGVTIRGLPEISRKLKKLEPALGKKIIRKAFRAALKPVRDAVRANLPSETGTLRKAVKVMSGRSRKGRITMRVVIGAAAFKGGRFYGAFRDLGTRKLAGSDGMKRGFDETKDGAKAAAERLILEGIEAELKR
jgi:HK97 gp10 family phage protein